jgi:hypothetical protein
MAPKAAVSVRQLPVFLGSNGIAPHRRNTAWMGIAGVQRFWRVNYERGTVPCGPAARVRIDHPVFDGAPREQTKGGNVTETEKRNIDADARLPLARPIRSGELMLFGGAA